MLVHTVFDLTGRTGSYLYMSPEVARCEAYNDRADVRPGPPACRLGGRADAGACYLLRGEGHYLQISPMGAPIQAVLLTFTLLSPSMKHKKHPTIHCKALPRSRG